VILAKPVGVDRGYAAYSIEARAHYHGARTALSSTTCRRPPGNTTRASCEGRLSPRGCKMLDSDLSVLPIGPRSLRLQADIAEEFLRPAHIDLIAMKTCR
jgi:hypothetical protein